MVTLTWSDLVDWTPNGLPPPNIFVVEVVAVPKFCDVKELLPLVTGLDLLEASELLIDGMELVSVLLDGVTTGLNNVEDANSPAEGGLFVAMEVLITGD